MKTDCCVIRDLLPLFAEDLVSDETAQVIRLHLQECPDCRHEYEQMRHDEAVRTKTAETPSDSAIKPFRKMMKKANRTLSAMCFALTVMLLFLGVVKSDGENAMLLVNAVIMPVCGACGYVAFGKKAFFLLPLLLFATDAFAYIFRLLPEDIHMIAWLSCIYCIFIFAGILIAALLHYAFRKE